MSVLVAGLFTESEKAGEAIADLKSGGYTEAISFVVRDDDGDLRSETVKNDVTDGAATGAGIGALAGAVTGVVAAIIPAAPLVIAGPLAVAWGVTGTALGALSGGLVGALVDLGFGADVAEVFEARILEGDVLVTATVEDDLADEVIEILERNDVYEIAQLVEA